MSDAPISEKVRRDLYREVVVYLMQHGYGFSYADVARLFRVSRQAIRKVHDNAVREGLQ